MPIGPSILVLPGSGRSFEQFRSDDYVCRQFAFGQVQGVTPNQAAITTGVANAATGAALGAAAGAAMGGQCMYEQGHRVPVPGHVVFEDRLDV